MLVSKVSKDAAETKGKKISQEVSGCVSTSKWNGEQRKLTQEEKQKEKEVEEFTQKKEVAEMMSEKGKELDSLMERAKKEREMDVEEKKDVRKLNSEKKKLKKKGRNVGEGSQVELPSSNMEDNLDHLKAAVGEERRIWTLGTDDVGDWHNMAAPMIDVCSVTIHSNDGTLCKIYGKIYYHDVEGAGSHLYKRERRDAETILSGDSLLLDCRRGGVMAANVMLLELKDTAHNNAWFAKGRLVLDTETEDGNAEVKFATYQGNLGKVFVYYIVIPYSVIAQVKFELIEAETKEDGVHGDVYEREVGVGNEFHAYVCGTVVARYGNTYGRKINQRTIYSQLDRLQEVTLGNPIKLYRSAVCVPVCSSLIIDMNLRFSIGNKVITVDQSQELDTLDGGTCRRQFDKEDICIKVYVCWWHPYWIFPWKKFDRASNKETKASRKGFKPNFDKQMSSALSIRRNPSIDSELGGSPGLQVFSVFICHDHNEVLSLCGTIRAIHGRGSTCFFRKDKSCPEMLDPHSCNALPLKGRMDFTIGAFGLYLNFTDVEDHVLIKGYLSYRYQLCFTETKERDKPICSIIRGDHAYAAVHYIGLAKALEATVEIFVVCKDSTFVCANVHGRIIARYGYYKYASQYEAKCYQCVLFEKRENDQEVLTGESQARLSIPLSTSKFLVPVSDILVIEVDLHVCFQATGGSKDEHLTDNVVFSIGNDGKSVKIDGQDFQIGFSIEWHDEVW